MGSSSGSQPSSSLKQKKHWARSGSFSVGQWTKPAAAICQGERGSGPCGGGSPASRVAPGPRSLQRGGGPGGRVTQGGGRGGPGAPGGRAVSPVPACRRSPPGKASS